MGALVERDRSIVERSTLVVEAVHRDDEVAVPAWEAPAELLETSELGFVCRPIATVAVPGFGPQTSPGFVSRNGVSPYRRSPVYHALLRA
jgi:hypothetical protein